MSKGKWQKKFEKLQKEYQKYKEHATGALIELSNKNQAKKELLDNLNPRIATLEAKSKEIGDELKVAQTRNHESEVAVLQIDHRHKETLAFCAITEMRLAATDPELNFWQNKAEDLVAEFIRTGTIDSETIRRIPITHPYGPQVVEKANYRRSLDAKR